MFPGDFFFVVIGHRGAIVDATEAVDSAGIEEQRETSCVFPAPL